MKNLSEIKEEKQLKIDTLIKETQMFFAFSWKQFSENKTPLKKGEKYVGIGAGAYIPKGNLDLYIKGIEEIEKTFKAELKKSKQLRYDHIKYELSNYEAYYTRDISDTLEALGGDYTKKEVWKVFKENDNSLDY